jgi:hypothetical protein
MDVKEEQLLISLPPFLGKAKIGELDLAYKNHGEFCRSGNEVYF